MSTSKTIELLLATPRQRKVFDAAAGDAALLGHTLNETWYGNAHGFHATCSKCGKVAGVTISSNTKRPRRGDAFVDACPNPKGRP